MTKLLLILLFFSLPLVHGGVFTTLWIDFKLVVSGNFEFTKTIFFNILSSLILVSFCIDSFFDKKNSLFSKREKIIWGLIITLLFLSTLFSLSPLTSMIWDDNKGHTALLFFNLLWIFFVLRNLNQDFLKQLIYTSLLSGVCVSFLAIKELYSPSFNYGHLANRALGSFGHPNYLAWYLLLLLPLITLAWGTKKQMQPYLPFIRGGLGGVVVLAILLSKSIVAIVLAGLYIGYLLTQYLIQFSPQGGTKLQYSPLFWKRGALGWVILTVTILTLVTLYLPEKLHSFLSRFYLWETTLSIIFSDWRIFLFGGGLETLSYVFESFKSPEVYIYENFWFTADRPHNFLLNIFYHFGILWLGIFIYLVYSFIISFWNQREYPKGEGLWNSTKISILLFLLFGIIHFFSIASYLIVVLCISYISVIPKTVEQEEKLKKISSNTITFGFLIFSVIWAYYSLQFYTAEQAYAQKEYTRAQSIFSHPKYLWALGRFDDAQDLEAIESPQLIKSQIQTFRGKEIFLCNRLIELYPSAENYLYCWAVFEKSWNTELSLEYYKTWLSLLPDLWREDSPYWDNYFIKNTITGNRFFSEKFWDIRTILEKVEK